MNGRCYFLQKLVMLEVFFIVHRQSLLKIHDQSRSLGTAVSALSTFFYFLYLFTPLEYSIGTFLRLNQSLIILLRKILPDRLDFSQFACCDLPC